MKQPSDSRETHLRGIDFELEVMEREKRIALPIRSGEIAEFSTVALAAWPEIFTGGKVGNGTHLIESHRQRVIGLLAEAASEMQNVATPPPCGSQMSHLYCRLDLYDCP